MLQRIPYGDLRRLCTLRKCSKVISDTRLSGEIDRENVTSFVLVCSYFAPYVVCCQSTRNGSKKRGE